MTNLLLRIRRHTPLPMVVFVRMFRKQVHAKPCYDMLYPNTYVLLELTPIENFFDDWQRYGLTRAIKVFRKIIMPPAHDAYVKKKD